MTNKDTINSDLYWNTRFAQDWEASEGPRQSRFFARIAIEHLPRWLIEQLKRQSLTFADWGCAQGDGADVWASYIDAKQIVGVDFSSVAIEQAVQRYPAIRFINEDWLAESGDQGEAFDVVFSSNTLEHFHKPYDALHAICRRAKKAIVLALPYKELERIDEHFFSFLPENIPLQLANGFRLIWSRVVDCQSLPNSPWEADQVILVYADYNWVDGLGLTLSDYRIEQSDTATEIGRLNTIMIERDGQIASLNQAVVERDGQLASVNQVVAERDGQIASLNQVVAERDEQIASLNQAAAERDGQITSLNHTVAERDGQLASVNQVVAERDGQILSLNQTVAERDEQIASLNVFSHSKEAEILKLKSSTSWVLTRPLRFMKLFFQNPKKSVYDLAKFVFWRLSSATRQALQGPRHNFVRWVRELPAPVSVTPELANNCPSDLSWEDFSAQILSRRGEYKGIFVQELAIDWNVPLYQRPQHIATAFGRLDYLVIYKTDNWVGDNVDGFREVSKNVWITNRDEVNKIEDVVRSFYSTAFQNTPELMLKNGKRGVLVYEYIDHIDPQISGDDTENIRRLLAIKDFAFGGGADYIVASARKLEAEAVMAVGRDKVILVQNGVDTLHYRNSIHQSTPLSVNLIAFKKKYSNIVGYFGALAPWLWYEVVSELVEARPDLGFVFIGPDYLGGLEKLPKAENVLYLGTVDYKILPAYARQFDICFIPFAPGEIARTTSPLKLFEYFALEKPVVVTSEMLECVAFKEVFSGDSASTLSQAIDQAILVKNIPDFKDKLAQLADQNNWDERARAMAVVFNLINGCTSDLSWEDFSAQILSRRGEYKGIFVQELVIDWNVPRYQRPQHIATAFGRLGYLVIYKTDNWVGDNVDGFREVSKNVWITNRDEVNKIEGVVRSFYSTAYANTPELMLKNCKRGVLVYEYIDHIDPQISGDDTENIRRLLALKYFAFGRGADYIVASAGKLEAEAVKAVGRDKVILAQNGVDTVHYRNPIHQSTPLPENLRSFRKKYSNIVGYFGSLAPWLWYEAVSELVEARPDLGFVFIGPDCYGGVEKLPKAENVQYLGTVDYKILPAYARQFDICFIPFAPGEIAKTTLPLKLFEYFALEKPVVVTSEMLECVAFKEVFSGDSASALSQAIDAAIQVKNDAGFKKRLAELAEENDWEARAKAMEFIFQCN